MSFPQNQFSIFFDPADTQASKQAIKQTIYVYCTLLYEKENNFHDYCRYLVLFSRSQPRYIFVVYILFKMKIMSVEKKEIARIVETNKNS